ncbi:DNA-binding response regulator [Paenibacillus psychroresistens]|uniref:DNA-binding response regulator n=1 Tax=Paenibacillus psychroresistens TaxID=1778678 RepID=A0A6B8RRR6_9BACL|nr:response regulator transcription factor [Paenibacillus psychroresistens]QGQ97958.1 DNA-binding response regulator [Paenibacillus psychroresistens]
MSIEILLVEDEDKIARVLQLELTHEKYTVQIAETGRKGLLMALAQPWDLIILDVMLPELNGLEVLRRIRQTITQTPIMLLSARDSVPERVSGLDLGANDYITKPFAIEELLARVRNLLRMFHREVEHSTSLQIADLSIDLKTRKVQRNNRKIDLTFKEFELLHYFIRNQGRVLTREQIMHEVWGHEYVGDTNVVDVFIRHLRMKIDQDPLHPLIHTTRGVGYCLKEVEYEPKS